MMEKCPYDEFICSDSRDIGPAPWNQVPQPQILVNQNQPSEERKINTWNKQHQEQVVKLQKEPHKARLLLQGKKVANTPQRAPKRFQFFIIAFLGFATVLGLWQSKELACGTGITLCMLTRFFCNNDLLSYPFNIPLKVGCSLTPLLRPSHPQLVNEYCHGFSWPWFPLPIGVESDPFPPQNHASSVAGASIISELTSPTHGVLKRPWGSYFTKSLNHKIHIPPAFVILEDSIINGDCWRFSGQTGKVGVRLSSPIVVSHITFDYVNASLLSSAAMAAVPQNMSLWSFVDDIPEFKSLGRGAKKTPSEFAARGEYKKDGVFIRVAEFQYNISLSVTKQRFSTYRRMSAPTRDLVLVVESNGGGNTTCLYWVGIHGHAGQQI